MVVIPALALRIGPLHQERLALPVEVAFVDYVAISIEFSNDAGIAVVRAGGPILTVEVGLFLDIVVFVIGLADTNISFFRARRMVIRIEEFGLDCPPAGIV